MGHRTEGGKQLQSSPNSDECQSITISWIARRILSLCR